MRIIRFYLPKPLAVDTVVELTDDALHHAVNVLRMKVGDTLTLFNGEGGEYEAVIASASKKSSTVQINTFNNVDRESPLRAHLAIGISKGERFDLVLQKATELGVSEITPLFTERTEVRLSSERQEKIRQRWQNIIINACEQSQRNRLPKLNSPIELHALFSKERSEQHFILHPPEDNSKQTSFDKSAKPKSVCLLVGPEGGFSDMEFKLATKNNFTPLALGPRILRTETAPLAALSMVQMLWGDIAQ